MPARNLIIVLLAAVISLACYQKAQRDRYVGTISRAISLIDERYVEEVDRRRLFESALDGMVKGLDPYSNYIAPERYQQFQESLDQQFGGIGIMVEGPPRVERLTVATPLVNTPAFKAGILAGDVILEIDSVTTEGMKLEDAVKLMRGPKGSPVTLLIQHPGTDAPRSVTVRRDIIPIESVLGDRRQSDGSWEYFLEEDPRVGYIRLQTFGDRTLSELREALRFPDHDVKALILDLRGNAGGLLDSAVGACDLFLQGGTIVSTRGRNGVIQSEYTASEKVAFDPKIPMTVLVDHFSASAAEILAAALQDHGRAIVVGERSFGKGTVQNIIELEGGRSALKLTTARYWRPNGQNIHRLEDAKDEDAWGVRPNDGFEVVMEEEEYTKVRMQRRLRDLMSTIDNGGNDAMPSVETPIDIPPESNSDDTSGTPPSGESDSVLEDAPELNNDKPVVDRQLQRAVDHLRQQMDKRASARRAA